MWRELTEAWSSSFYFLRVENPSLIVSDEFVNYSRSLLIFELSFPYRSLEISFFNFIIAFLESPVSLPLKFWSWFCTLTIDFMIFLKLFSVLISSLVSILMLQYFIKLVIFSWKKRRDCAFYFSASLLSTSKRRTFLCLVVSSSKCLSRSVM